MITAPKRRRLRFGLRTPFVVVTVGGCASLVNVISPAENTVSAMGESSFRIGIYLRQNGRLPDSLDILPVRPGYTNATTDGWGRPLRFQLDGDRFTITSLGRDGIVGGTGDDTDLVRKYRIVDGAIDEIR
jgi:hypothetical protein